MLEKIISDNGKTSENARHKTRRLEKKKYGNMNLQETGQ